MGSLPLQAFHYYGQPIMATPVHTAEVAEKPTCPAGRDENANAKNGLTFDPRPTMAKKRPINQPASCCLKTPCTIKIEFKPYITRSK